MLVRFALPPCPDSPLARLDPRWRLAALLLALVGAALLRTLTASLLALAGAFLLARLAAMPWGWFGPRLAALVAVLALFVLPMPFLSHLPWGEGLLQAAVIFLKAVALLTLASVLVVTAPMDVTLRAAHALWIPGLLVQLSLLSYRYLFVLGDELARLRIALRVRGFRNLASLRSYRTVAAATGTLLVRGQERAERVAAAMRCRGFDGQFRTLTVFCTRGRDILVMLGTTVLVLGLCVLDRVFFPI